VALGSNCGNPFVVRTIDSGNARKLPEPEGSGKPDFGGSLLYFVRPFAGLKSSFPVAQIFALC